MAVWLSLQRRRLEAAGQQRLTRLLERIKAALEAGAAPG